ncbi:MAG: OmpA/MotB family protein [Rhodospirillaceae bacterium]
MIGPNRRFETKKEEDDESWIVTFSDMVTLLLAFFIILISISTIDPEKFDQVRESLQEEIGADDLVDQPIKDLRNETENVIKVLEVEDDVRVAQDDQGLIIEFASSAFYEPGSAEIREEMIPVLEEIVKTLDEPRYQTFQIIVQGHTDDTPISTEQFPSNWELSAARATRVVRFMEAQQVQKDRMLAIGYADIAPKVPNRDEAGNPVPEFQELNRRVVIRVFPRHIYRF